MKHAALSLSQVQKQQLDTGFANAFGALPTHYLSAPGRTELSGNHTDHQRGCVLAAAVNLDTRAAVACNGTEMIRVCSQGYPPISVDIRSLTPTSDEVNTTAALVRGVAAGFAGMGCKLSGFDAYIESTVLPGSGLSSSAAFEVLTGTIINHLFFDTKASAVQVAQIGQYAENVFFGKPCGLMDQTASAVGGIVAIDFTDPKDPAVQPLNFDFSTTGYALCIIDSRASHADLTDEYAAITRELKAVCAYVHKDVLTQVDEAAFYAALPTLRAQCGDRAVMRAIHVFEENRRVPRQVEALARGDFDAFLQLENESGQSSWMYLQNVIPTGNTAQQAVAVALALCRHYLNGRGACRVHGGGFAGTVQAFVPLDMLEVFRVLIDAALGAGACHLLSIRHHGGVPMVYMGLHFPIPCGMMHGNVLQTQVCYDRRNELCWKFSTSP